MPFNISKNGQIYINLHITYSVPENNFTHGRKLSSELSFNADNIYIFQKLLIIINLYQKNPNKEQYHFKHKKHHKKDLHLQRDSNIPTSIPSLFLHRVPFINTLITIQNSLPKCLKNVQGRHSPPRACSNSPRC